MKAMNKQQKQLTQAQVLRKLEKSGVNSSEEYELIIANLQQQNLRLMKDRQQLKIRVDILLQKQHQLLEQHKANQKNKKNPTIDYARLKKQLQHKYKQYELWKKRCYNSINKGALNLQVKAYMNKCIAVEAEIDQFKKALADEKRTLKNLQKSIKSQLKRMNKNVPQRQIIQEQNKQLRRMIWNLRIEEDLTGHVDVRVHSSIVRLQGKKRFVEKLKTMTIEQIRRQEAKTKMEIINEQIKQKKQMKLRKLSERYRQKSQRRMKTESRISSQKLSMDIQREEQKEDETIKQKQKQLQAKQEQNKKVEEQLISLDNEKNTLAKEQSRLNEVLQKQQAKIAAKKAMPQPQYADVCLQVQQFEDDNPLPVQVIGNETSLLQNDRAVLKGSKDTFITGLIAYQNKSGISCIRALYSNGKQTSCIPPQKYLTQKCKNKKIILSDPKDYLKWIKAYYDKSESKLIRLQVYSNNKLKFEIGKQKQLMLKNVIAYKFDNSVQEIPVCVRVSYRQQDEDWIISSFGVEVNSK